MICKINPEFESLRKEILALPERFRQEGKMLKKDRNVIKVLEVAGITMNVKSFKQPNFINQFA